jgi:hypothetical protein
MEERVDMVREGCCRSVFQYGFVSREEEGTYWFKMKLDAMSMYVLYSFA